MPMVSRRLVRPLAELTRYGGSSQDARDLVIRARIIDVTGKCEPGDDETIVTRAQVVVEATRGPAMQGDAIGLPVFIAVWLGVITGRSLG